MSQNIFLSLPYPKESNSVEYCIIGVQILTQLTCEVNQISGDEASRSIAKQRKIASSFRDTLLYEIFQISHDFLRRALEIWKNTNFEDTNQKTLIHHLLRLSLSCLSFDFIGTSPDESSDDLTTVQIPTNWKPAFLDFNTLQLFFDLYRCLPSALSPLVSKFQDKNSLVIDQSLIYSFISYRLSPAWFKLLQFADPFSATKNVPNF